jgi:hypothetical protein
MNQPRNRESVAASLGLGAAVLWQLYVVLLAYRNAPIFRSLFSGVGGELPLVTRAFFASYKGWILVPALFAILSWDLLRRKDASLLYFALVLGASLLAALALQAWMSEAMFQPLFSILKAIG